MEVLVLGSGTSHGVPMIGCQCAVCTSSDPRNRRFRPSIAVRASERTILVDATPELRLQALTFGLDRVDAVLVTHTHADHIMGLDDIRRFNDLRDAEVPVYGDPSSLDDIRRIFRYVFVSTQVGGGKPRITLHDAPDRFELCGIPVRSLRVYHGRLPILAYRFGPFAYVTDVNRIPPETMDALRGLDTLMLDTVRPTPHETHFGLQEALDVIAELSPRSAYLTHLSHHYDHAATNATLPPGVELAYDGLTLRFDESE